MREVRINIVGPFEQEISLKRYFAISLNDLSETRGCYLFINELQNDRLAKVREKRRLNWLKMEDPFKSLMRQSKMDLQRVVIVEFDDTNCIAVLHVSNHGRRHLVRMDLVDSIILAYQLKVDNRIFINEKLLSADPSNFVTTQEAHTYQNIDYQSKLRQWFVGLGIEDLPPRKM